MKLHWKILIGMALGIVFGLLINDDFGISGPVRVLLDRVVTPLLDPIGTIFITLLKMLIVPLILASMVLGVARVGDIRKLGGLGARTFVFYIMTTWMSVLIGLVAVNVIRPGVGAPPLPGVAPEAARNVRGFWDTIVSMIPSNPVEAMANMDILPIIVFSLFFGAILTTMGKKAEPLVNLFDSLNDAMLRMADVVIKLTPYAVFALLASVVADTGPLIFANLGKYMLTVLIGLAVHAAVVLPLLLKYGGRVSPSYYLPKVAPALTTAFSTSSSSATLPLTMDVVNRAGVSKRVSSFVLPIGATINMDGTALYESVAAVFIAQVYGIELSIMQQVVVFLTATLAAIGAAGIPSAGLVTMAIVLNAVGLPLEGIGMILAVDRILDMCRTTINVWGDMVGCAVVSRLEGEPVPSQIRHTSEGEA